MEKEKPDFEQSIEAFLGSKIHETLDFVYKKKEEFSLDRVIKYFIESWNGDYKGDLKIVREDLKTEYYFNKGIKFLIDYYLKHYPFIDDTIETEKKICVYLDEDKEYSLIGYIDRLVRHKDTNDFEIHDYKTGSLKSQEELDKDRQLAIYSLGIREIFNNVNKVKLVWHFLDSNQMLSSERTLEQLEKLKKEILEIIKRIESTEEFKPNKTKLCDWCEYKSKCPEFRNQHT